jgi:hypothetical protein
MPKSLWGSSQPHNIRTINDNFHKAFHRVFDNRSPLGQLELLADFNAPCLSMDFRVRVNELLKDAQDPEYVYRKGVLVPR